VYLSIIGIYFNVNLYLFQACDRRSAVRCVFFWIYLLVIF